MNAAHRNNEPMNQVNPVNLVDQVNPVNLVDPLNLVDQPVPESPAASSRTPIGETLKAWAPVVVAIVVPGGFVIALAMLVRRWYRGRAVRPPTFA